MLTWDKIKDKKEKQYEKELEDMGQIIEYFDISNAMQNLMKRIHKNGPGSYSYHIIDLRSNNRFMEFCWVIGYTYLPWMLYKETRDYVYECMCKELENNGIGYIKVKGYYSVIISLP